MKLRHAMYIAILVTCLAFLAQALDAEAARFGGGRSFGGSPSSNKSFSMPKSPSSSLGAASTQKPSAAASGSQMPGMRPAFGGMLGGLLAGSLIGSLLLGGGFHGGGMMDILLIGLVLYVVFKFLGRRRSSAQPLRPAQAGGPQSPIEMTPTLYDTAPAKDTVKAQSSSSGFDWDALRAAPAGSTADNQAMNSADANAKPFGTIPASFDREEFLTGAKAAYQRLNSAWDKRDIDDIAQFATQPFMQEIQKQAEEDPNPSTTEIMLVNAQLLNVVTESGRETATVFFDTLLRENPQDSAPAAVKEVWHFVRAAGSAEMWKLDGIQQVAVLEP